MAAMMGRESAYTGLEKTWEEMTASSLNYSLAEFSLDANIDMSSFVTPVPGKSKEQ